MNTASREVFVEAVGLAAPGFANWESALPILREEQIYTANTMQSHAPALLPPNERRRATQTVRIAFQAAEDAMQSCSIAAAELATVFASSDADLNIIHRICSALTVEPRMISPTDFHNSVHNAAAGYWSIAVGSRSPSTTISAHDYSFTTGLVEACGVVSVDGCDTLLVAFDLPPPEPLFAKRPMSHPTGVALVLTRQSTQKTLASLRCERVSDPETASQQAELEALRIGNPAARALPLLTMLALRRSGRVVLPLNADARLAVDLRVV